MASLFHLLLFPPYLNGSTGSCTRLIGTVMAIEDIIQDVSTGSHRIHENRHMLVDLAQVIKSVREQKQMSLLLWIYGVRRWQIGVRVETKTLGTGFELFLPSCYFCSSLGIQ